MSRHQQRQEHGGTSSEREEEAGGGRPSSTDQARAAKLKQVRETRNVLKGQVSKAVQAISLGTNLFQGAVRGMGEEELKKKLELNVAERVKDGLIDKIAEKFKEGVVEATDIGKAVASRCSSVFGEVKSVISERIKAQSELSVLEAADIITSAMIEKATVLERELCESIDALPREKVLGIRQVLAQFNGIEDEADSPETGRLEDGMKEWAMTDLIGLPSGDGVAIEEYGRTAFASFQEAVRSTMTAAEAGDAIQHRLAHPNEDQERIEEQEEKMGPAFKQKIERDKGMRKRVAATGGDQ